MRTFKILILLSFLGFFSNSVLGKTWLADYASSSFLSESNQKEFFNFFDNYPANVHRLTLSQAVIFADCGEVEERCSENKQTIEILTEARDPYNDVLTYHYNVSGGKIIGNGKNVTWDLSDIKPGEYTITAGVDDGCGICGQTKTAKIYIVKCPETVRETITPGFISALKLNQNETFSSCDLSKNAKFDSRSKCFGKKSMIFVATNAYKSNDTNAVFRYEVTDGQIIGNGDDVYWDLSQAKPGTHIITATVDAGRGFCTNSVSESVRVSECPKCKG